MLPTPIPAPHPMFHLPAIPDWDGMHVIVIHFPVALLMTAPFLIFLGLIIPRLRSGFFIAGMVMLALGCAGAFVSVSTGEAAARVADRTAKITKLIERHGRLADQVKYMYLGLSFVWLAILAGPKLGFRWFSPRLQVVAVIAFLLVNIPGSLLIANMAHVGGILVHDTGVHAMMPVEPAEPEAAPTATASSKKQH